MINVVEMAESTKVKLYQFEQTALASYSDHVSDLDESNTRTGKFHRAFGKHGLV